MKEVIPTSISVNTQPIFPVPLKYQLPKRWKTAQRTSIGETVRRNNQLTEYYYKEILSKAKELYAPLALNVFERDYREDNTENAFAMHSFLTPSFYWYLECSLSYDYKVNYDFDHCPFEAELKAMIEQRYYYLQTATHHPLQPNCAAYFTSIQQVQAPEHFYLLK